MESPFDRLNKESEDKSAKKKTNGKKKWLLSRQYLQQLEEPDDDVVNKEPYTDLSVKDKLRCICRSAFYGMKEGLLTGVFLGGFLGVLKFLNGNGSAFFGSTGSEENSEKEKISKHYYGSGVPKERKNTGRSRRTDMRIYSLLGREQSGNRNSSLSYEEKFSSYRTIEETLYGFNREHKSQNLNAAKRSRNIDPTYSKLPIRTDKYSISSSSRVGDKKKYIVGKTTGKVEIVGYAFVQTMGAFEADSTKAKNVEYNSPKQSKEELGSKYKEEEEEEEEEREQCCQRNKLSVDSGQTFLSQCPGDSKKSSEKSKLAVRERSSRILKTKESGLNEKHQKSAKSLKSKEDVVIGKGEKSAKSLKIEESLLDPKQERSNSLVRNGSGNVVDDSTYPSRVLGERAPKESLSKGFHKAFSSLKSATSKNKSRQSVISEAEEEKQKPSRITIVSPKFHLRDSSQGGSAEQSSSILIKSLEPDQSEISTRLTSEPSQDSRLRQKDSNKSNKSNKSTKRVSKPAAKSSVIMESEVSIPKMPPVSSKTTRKSFEYSEKSLSENLYPSFRAPSYLVNVEDVSNGYTSPVTVASPEQQSEHNTIHSKFSESSFSPYGESSRAELDDVGFTGSNFSEFPMRPFHTFSPSVNASQPDQSTTSKNSKRSISAAHDSNRVQTEESTLAMPQSREESNINLKTAKESRSEIFSDSGRSTAQKDRSNFSELLNVQHFEKPISASKQVSEKSNVSRKYSSEKQEKSFLSSEQVTEESPVAGSFDKSFVSSEQVSEKAHVVSKYSSEKSEKSFTSNEQVSVESPTAGSFHESLLLSEQVFEKSHVADEFPSEKSLLSSETLKDRSRISDQFSPNTKTKSQDSTDMSFAEILAKSNSSLIQDVGPDGSRSSVAKGAHAASWTQKSLKKEVKEFGLFSSLSDNTIVLYACNCAIVIGILCTVISTTRASLKI